MVNHLLKIIQFYKLLKENDKMAINKIILNNNLNSKQVKIEDFVFNYYSNDIEENECKYCLDELYKHSLPLITIEIQNEYYMIKQPHTSILYWHFEINNLKHHTGYFELDQFKMLNDLFPSYMILYHTNNHFHFDLGLIESAVFNKDANHFFNNTYIVEWYLKTYLIKEKDFNDLIDEYNTISSKIPTGNKTYAFFKRWNKYYLYIIIHSEKITPFEAIGFFTISDHKNSLSSIYNDALEKITQNL